MKEEIKNLKTYKIYQKSQFIYKAMLMLSYYLNCNKNTDSKSSNVAKTNKRKLMLLLKCAVVDSKKSRFLKELETSGLLITLRIKIPILSKIPVVGDTLS